jgi:hypothetical protein
MCGKYDNGLFIVRSRKLSEVHQNVGKIEHLLHESEFKPTSFRKQIMPPSVQLFPWHVAQTATKILHM